MAKWLLIDGFNLTFRSFYAIPELTRSDGMPTNALHGWVRMLWKLEELEKPDHIATFFDLGGPQRHLAILPEYKANRSETPELLVPQIPWIKRLSLAMGYSVVEQAGVEADDLLASAAYTLKRSGETVKIVSADKDFAQCIQAGITQLLPPPTANPRIGWRQLDPAGVETKFGVTTGQIPDYLALVGDSSDNIPGVPGVGPKTASSWLQEHSSVAGVVQAAKEKLLKPKRFVETIPEMEQDLLRNLELTTLREDYNIDKIYEFQPDNAALIDMLDTLEMKTAAAEARKRCQQTLL